MKFSYSWLKSLLPLTESPEDLAEKLTMAGLEVESIDSIGTCIEGITTGKIESISPHPNADKLVITSVSDGKNSHQIVTGAKNISVGDIIPVSLPGSVVASGMKLKQTALRGVDSFGMLCSETECGITDESEGIWILPSDTPLGVDFVEYAILKDSILDIAILPNRGDCQSIWGLAREIAAITGETLSLPKVSVSSTDIKHSYSVQSQSSHCPLYIGRYISSINKAPTPLWMKRRLELCGIRPISLIVDVTNYVLLETGHPLHAFDDAKCASKSISIIESTKKHSLTTLDSQKRSCQEGQLLICEGNTPVALAGIMGAENTEVSPDTSAIFLEAAYFTPHIIRRSATLSGLRTDSSSRFEKGTNIETTELASQRAAMLLQELGQATVSNHVITCKDNTHELFKSKSLPFDINQLNSFLGSNHNENSIKTLLTTLGFTIKNKQISIPSWRREDISDWPCIAEEIARLKGFDSIPSTLPTQHIIQDQDSLELTLTRSSEDFFVHNGFTQLNTYPMVSEDDIKHCKLSTDLSQYGLANPISPELAVLRPSLLPSFLRIISHHSARQQHDCAFVEVGSHFNDNNEEHVLAFCLTGSPYENTASPDQRSIAENSPFIHLQSLLQRLEAQLGYSFTLSFDSPDSWHHPVQFQHFSIGNINLGSLALVHPSISSQFNIHHPLAFGHLSLTRLASIVATPKQYRHFSSFPSTRRDIACCVPKSLSYAEILSHIHTYKHKSVVDIGIFDLFESEKLGPDNKSIGIYLIYQDLKQTLADEKVNKAHQRLCDQLVKQLPLTIR
ncbi:phenylalanine--tRNA ligase subunit beta [Candidatus Marinamargulisbacteria bacterium SCGC AG-343-D04]|nr:phenylalanine--tRNA ligase subunit beta [Candidatus Marinamargulisbacteria bacterium SCGC AG-343-D04]